MYALDGLRTHKGTIPTKWLARMHYGLMARSIYNGLAYTAPYVQEQHTAQLLLRYKPSVFVPAPTRGAPPDTPAVRCLVGRAGHAGLLDALVALVQSPDHDGETLFASGTAASLRTIFDETAISFCTVLDGEVCGVLTFHVAHTMCGEPVAYASVLKVHVAHVDARIGGMRPSAALMNAWMCYVSGIAPVGGIGHLVTQSVGYRHIMEQGQPICVESGTHLRGTRFWRNHEFVVANREAAVIGFQLGVHLGAAFLDLDCCFLHRTLRGSVCRRAFRSLPPAHT